MALPQRKQNFMEGAAVLTLAVAATKVIGAVYTITFRRSVRPATSHSSPIPTLRLQLRTALSQRLLTHLQQRIPRSHTTLRRQLRTRTLRHRLVPLPVAVLQQPRTQRAKTLQRGVCEDLPLDIVLLLQSL